MQFAGFYLCNNCCITTFCIVNRLLFFLELVMQFCLQCGGGIKTKQKKKSKVNMRRASPLCDYAGALLRELCVNKSAAANEANVSVLPRNLIRTSRREASQVPRGLRVFGPRRRPLCGVNTEALKAPASLISPFFPSH